MLPRSSAASKTPCAASGFVSPPVAVRVSAPDPTLDRFRPSISALALLAQASASMTRIEICCPTPVFHVWAFSRLRNLHMPAADFWRLIPAPRDDGSPKANHQISPGITHSPSRLSLSDLRRSVPCKYWALHLLACSPRCVASIRWLFVRAALCLKLPPDPTSRWAPLLFG